MARCAPVSCETPEEEDHAPGAEWVCPVCGHAWYWQVEDEPEFYEAWWEPAR